MRTLKQTLKYAYTKYAYTKYAYTKKSLCVDTKNFLAFTQKLGQTLNAYTKNYLTYTENSRLKFIERNA